jgi:hypothetical protein
MKANRHERYHVKSTSFQSLPAVSTLLLTVLAMVLLAPAMFAQVPTGHNDSMRTGANTNETLLTPENVGKRSFGHLFSVPFDDKAFAQPLFVPGVSIPGQGTHDVVYVATEADSVYAFDAGDGTELWHALLLDGGVPASGPYLPCNGAGGIAQEGIIGTPVIDTTVNPPSMYVVAKNVFNATVYHYLHVLDVTTGLDKVAPVQLAATSTSLAGTVTNFTSLHQKNRPGLLLTNGVLYAGFGSNGCNDNNTGWVLAYDATTLQQLGAFNTSPDIGHTSIWHTGNGLAADEAGKVYVSTAESNNYDVPQGGQSYCNSVLELASGNVGLVDFFTPWTVAYLNANDLDVSSVGPMVLPDQPGPYPHEVVASGKQAIIYVLNRDDMGQYVPGGADNVIQEFPLVAGGKLMASPAYWNGAVYYAPNAAPLMSFQVTNGLLVPFAQSARAYVGAHSPAISANGNTNGIVWVLSGGHLDAFDAISLKLLYSSSQSGTRDKFPATANFVTQTVANGRVYVATQTTLEAFGLFRVLTVASGNNQSGPVLTTLPAPVQITASNPYTGQPDAGVTVTFTDGNKGGVFNPPTAVTDANGNVSTMYTLPKKVGTYTLTVNAPDFGDITVSESATSAPATKLSPNSGAKQSGVVGTTLPNPLVARARDSYNNPVPGVTVNFTALNGGIPNPSSAITNAQGLATTYLTLGPTPGKASVTASSPGLPSIQFPETAVAGSGPSKSGSSTKNGGK